MPSLFHLYSRYARLDEQAIAFAIEHVRAADEVLFGSELFDARDMIRVARTVFETERSFEQARVRFMELSSEPRSDWALACLGESFAQASVQLRERGSLDAAQRVLAEQRQVLQRIVGSPLRSPLVSYEAVLSTLMYELKPATRGELIELQRLALAEALVCERSGNIMTYLCELADCHLQLGQVELALAMFQAIAQYDPTNIFVHNHIAILFSQRFPALAHAAATRALLLMPRDDTHALRPELRAIIEASQRARTEPLTGAAAALLRELQGQPGKRSRASLRTLCLQLAPEIEWLPARAAEPLPSSSELAQLRRDLQSLPRPLR